MSEVRYSIKDLENFTQIKAHTIRIWEQRYGLLTPKRTDTNIRYYSENDLKKILNINLLYGSGSKISKIASLSEGEIIDASKELIRAKKSVNQSEIDNLTLWILEFNGKKINDYLNSALRKMSIEDVYERVILAVFEKIGQLWQVNSISIVHEHYFSNIFKEFLIENISTLDSPSDSSKKAILFLHEHEEHEFGILLYYYILKSNGFTCHYLGQKIPINEVEIAASQINPKLIVTTFTAKISDKNFKKIEDELVSFSKNAEILVSGSQGNIDALGKRKSFHHLTSISQLKAIL